jgi:hypothetical protein
MIDVRGRKLRKQITLNRNTCISTKSNFKLVINRVALTTSRQGGLTIKISGI